MCYYDLKISTALVLPLINGCDYNYKNIYKVFVRNLCSISKANLILDTAKISLAPMSI